MKKLLSLILALAMLFAYAGTGSAEEAKYEAPEGANTLIKPVPGARTIKNLLATAMSPIGSTLYVWGGGWNEAGGKGSTGTDAKTIGLSPEWKIFYDSQGADYDFKKYRYKTHEGLDCSGFIGWTVYNTLNTESGGNGYVSKSTTLAKWFADCGWGTYVPAQYISAYHPGDIMSTDGHVFMALGKCPDGSLVLVHASPPCVQITGTWRPGTVCSSSMSEEEQTAIKAIEERESQAILLSNYYMSKYFPETHGRYPSHSRDTHYLTDYNQFVWNTAPGKKLSDPEGYQSMNVYEVLKNIFNDDGILLEEADGNVFANGVLIDNSQRKYPIMKYNGVLYYPLTYYDAKFLGLETMCPDPESGKLVISKSAESQDEYLFETGKETALPIGVPTDDLVYEDKTLTGEAGYPVVRYRGIIYVPLTIGMTEKLGIGITSSESGVYIEKAPLAE